jgi:hypothetical protein
MVRAIEGRSIDVVCVEGDVIASTEFALFINTTKLNERVAALGNEGIAPALLCKCNGVDVIDSLTGTGDSIAVIEPSGRIAFLDTNGSQSYFPSHFILRDMNLRKDLPNLIEIIVVGTDLSASCKVWLWGMYDNVCIVDIDGTVTVEDVRGYVETVYLGAVSRMCYQIYSL